jgi:hypothetical protein
MSPSPYRDIVGSAAWDALPRVLHGLHERRGDGGGYEEEQEGYAAPATVPASS